MDAEQQERWDRWARSHVALLGREVGKLADDVGNAVDELEQRIEQLSKDLDRLRAVVEGTVTPLRGRDVA
jgi:hypothetical protein